MILQLLSYLATDRNYFVTYSVAYALLKMARHTPITRMRAILSNLAKRGDSKERSTQKTVALTMDEAIHQEKLNSDTPYDLIDRWIALENSNRHFTVAYVLFVGKYMPDNQRYSRLSKLVRTDPTALQLALFQALQETKGELEKTLIVVDKWAMQETEASTLQHISCIVDELSKDNKIIALDLLDNWLISDSPSARWLATYTLFGAKGLMDEDRYPRLISLMNSNMSAVMAPLNSVLRSDSDQIAWLVLERLFESESGASIRPALASVLDQGVFEESESFIELVCSAQTHMIQWVAIYLLLVVRNINSIVRYDSFWPLVRANPDSFIAALDEALINLDTCEIVQEMMETILNENGLAGRKVVARAIDSAAINDQPKTHFILTNWESRNEPFQWTLVYVLLTGVHAVEEVRYSRLSRLIVQNPNVFVHALHEALNENDTKARAWDVLEALLKTEGSMGQSVALALTNATGSDTGNVIHLLEMWQSSSNKALRWASVYTSLVAENLSLLDKVHLIVPIMAEDVLTFILAVQSTFLDQESQLKSLVVLANLADPISGNRKLLVSTLFQGYYLRPETMQELRHVFLFAPETNVVTLPIETDAEIIKSVITQPSTYRILRYLSLRRFFEAIRFGFNNKLYQQ